MKIELNQSECNNIRIALRVTAKQSDVMEASMKALLILSDKFVWREEVKKEKPLFSKKEIDEEKEALKEIEKARKKI